MVGLISLNAVNQESAMTTTVFYHKIIHDKEKQDVKIELEFGGSSFYGGENLMYLRIDGKFMVLDRETGVKIFNAVQKLGTYLSFDEP
jgi:hypothetical protein